MDTPQAPPTPAPPVSGLHRRIGGIAGRVLLNLGFLAVGAAAYVAHVHLRVAGSSTASLASLVAAAGFGLMPLRPIVHALFTVERKVVHLAHGLVGLGLVGLGASGVASGSSVLPRAARAPFAIMAAAQALMHQDHPRNAAQAAALRRFATSLPEVEQITGAKDLGSPANAARTVAVMTDLIGKAQALGETELQSDPGFQGALRQVTARTGLSLGLDAIDRALGTMEKNPATAAAVPALRKQLAAARRAASGKATPAAKTAGS